MQQLEVSPTSICFPPGYNSVNFRPNPAFFVRLSCPTFCWKYSFIHSQGKALWSKGSCPWQQLVTTTLILKVCCTNHYSSVTPPLTYTCSVFSQGHPRPWWLPWGNILYMHHFEGHNCKPCIIGKLNKWGFWKNTHCWLFVFFQRKQHTKSPKWLCVIWSN